jgi:hypothetical protein
MVAAECRGVEFSLFLGTLDWQIDPFRAGVTSPVLRRQQEPLGTAALGVLGDPSHGRAERPAD